ncbi:MAG: hypothetical protein U0168_13250 [Nannocystaceae bacterium]
MNRRVQRGAQVGLLLLAAATPRCEAAALQRMRDGLERRGVEVGDWDLDLKGLHLHEIGASLGGRRLAAAAMDVALAGASVRVDVHALSIGRAQPTTSDEPPAGTAPSPESPATAARDRFRLRRLGLPIEVWIHDAVAIDVGDGTVALHDVRVDVDAQGWPALSARGEVQLPGRFGVRIDRLSAARSEGRWDVQAQVLPEGGAPLSLAATVADGGAEATLTDAAGQWLQLRGTIRRPARSRSPRSRSCSPRSRHRSGRRARAWPCPRGCDSPTCASAARSSSARPRRGACTPRRCSSTAWCSTTAGSRRARSGCAR